MTVHALRSFDPRREADEVREADALVIGSGVAGLSAALGLGGRRVTLLTKADLGGGSSSRWAQGGVAAALAADDSPSRHAEDTLEAGAGISDPELVEILTREGPERIRGLIALGGRFDRDPEGRLRLGREGAHSRRRILHAGGDATGREMVRALVAALRRHPDVAVEERAFVTDLVLSGHRVVGALARHADGRTVLHRAPAVILATGGFGQLYARTTNPPEATGDGLALAARAGAVLADLELVQFHPTALDAGLDPLPLVTEALRGEGAVLLDDDGHRFMLGEHPRAELAPRDVVARAIFARQKAGHRLWLDASGSVGKRFPQRFPTVWEACRKCGIDPRHEPIPVTPAAHYAMAGVAVDENGRASLPGLWACGEVTSTGVHGANRLASNSLLEALVFGARVADDVAAQASASPPLRAALPEEVWRESPGTATGTAPGTAPGTATGIGSRLDPRETRRRLRRLTWEEVGLVRHRRGLERALRELDHLAASLRSEGHGGVRAGAAPTIAELETRNLLTVGRTVAAAALARGESRGSHHRTDFPDEDPRLAERRFWLYRPGAGDFPLESAPALPDATWPAVAGARGIA